MLYIDVKHGVSITCAKCNKNTLHLLLAFEPLHTTIQSMNMVYKISNGVQA